MRTIEVKVTIESNGRLLVNFPIDMPVGEYNAVLILEDQPIQHQQTSIEKAQAIFRKYIPVDCNLAEELIQERREEALRE
ncbi:MAG: hypothetical protein HC916_00920 [Coleofasciculaceae cyanobacterium SM2_1_6]|nr:hypothetical protein [Coleofasciculaceae cyanobacterium SM2_1_6]